MSFGRAFTLVAVILGVLTIGVGVVCGVVVVQTRSFLDESTVTSGQVIELVSRQSCEVEDGERTCSRVYAPRVRFSTADGRRVVFESATASSPASYEEGDRVDVRYRTSDPDDARIDSVVDVWFGALLAGGFTLVLGVLAGVWTVLAVRFRAL